MRGDLLLPDPGDADPAASGASVACPRCGHSRERYTVDLPLGLGRRSWTADCPCEAKRRAAEAEARRQQERADRVRRLLRDSGIGPRHREATFETFAVTPASQPIVAVCRAFVEAFPDDGRGLTLSGGPGTGKTHLGVAITRALIERGHAAVIANVPRMFLTFRAALGSDHGSRLDEALELLMRCDHLLLDDLGRERPTEWVQETLYVVLDARYAHRRATSATTNLGPEALGRRVGEPLLDRLAETNRAYWCQWPSYRKGIAS